MKIAMMTNSYKPYVAGVPISIERLADGLMNLGHQVTVFAPTYEEQCEETDVFRYKSILKGIYYGFSVPNNMDRRIEKMFAMGNYDLIHVHHPMLIGWTALYLSHKYHVPLVFTYHTRYEHYLHYIKASIFKNIIPDYIRLFISQCDMVFAPTPLMKDYLASMAVKTEIAVLPTGLPDEHFHPDQAKAESIRLHLRGNKPYLFCTVARLAKEKNIGFLLECLAKRKNKQGSDFHFAIIGEGPEKNNLAAQAARLNLSEEVVFIGKVANDEIKNYCTAADLFLFASTSETQGIVLLESMAVGTPVLAVRATGVEDIIVNNFNGYMTSMSSNEYIGILDSLLSNNDICRLKNGAQETASRYRTQNIARAAIEQYGYAYRKRENIYRYSINIY